MILQRKFTVREGFAIFPWNHFTPGLYIGPPFVQSSSPDSSLSMFTTSYPSPLARDILALKQFVMPLHSLFLLPSLHFAATYPHAWQIFVHILSCSETKLFLANFSAFSPYLSLLLSLPFSPKFLPRAYI